MLLAHELIELARLLQSAGLALDYVGIHNFVFSLFNFLLNCAINIASEEGLLTRCALVKFAHTEGKL